MCWEKIRELNIWKMGLFQVKMGLKPSGWEFKHKKSDGNLAFAVSKLESVYTCSCAHLHTCIPLCSSFVSKGLKMIILPSRVLSMFFVVQAPTAVCGRQSLSSL